MYGEHRKLVLVWFAKMKSYDYFNRPCYINLKLNITQSKCFPLKHRTEKI